MAGCRHRMKANRLIGFLVGILIPWNGDAAEAVFQPSDTFAFLLPVFEYNDGQL